MSVIAVAAAKSSPGVSTVAELVVQLRPGDRRCVLLDCDPGGGDWLLRPGATREPGLVSLATTGRRDLAGDELLRHLQRFGDGLEVLVGPVAGRQAWSALELLGDRLVSHLHQLEGTDTVIDCGVLSPASPALPVVRAADLVVLVSRPTARAVVHLAPWVDQLVSEGAAAVLVALVEGPRSRHESAYRPEEVAEGLGVEAVGPIVHDPPGAAWIASEPGRLGRVRDSAVVRSAAPVAEAMFARAAAAPTSEWLPTTRPQAVPR
jgi:MinD-like ATPase involved in chromosome partitioning or flagellar assembly